MIRSPLGLRINPDPTLSPREPIREAARLGVKGVVLDAVGDLAPERLSETGRREVRHLLRSVELKLIALSLPTRRPFDSLEGLDDRLARAGRAFAMAYELGTNLVLARLGGVPAEADTVKRTAFTTALTELARRADQHGVRLAIETGGEPGSLLAGILAALGAPSLAASLDPAALLRLGHDPAQMVIALAGHVAHAYATDLPGRGALDWAEYLGALEEIDYRGFLTIWPEAGASPAATVAAIQARLDRY
jgi:sugar phosphate isomerase/epimerase